MHFEYILLFVVVTGITVSFYYCFVTGISPVSSTRKSRRIILDAIPIKTEGVIYELGAGWGALAFPLARRFKNARVVAYELSPFPWLFMKCWQLCFLGPRNLEIRRKNFLKVSLADAKILVCYLYPGAMRNLSPKLKKELNPKAILICNTFELPGCDPCHVEKIDDVMCPEIHIYQPGLRK